LNAARVGDLSSVKKLAADPALNLNWQEPQHGHTAFNLACLKGHVLVVEFLLKHPKVDVNKPQKNDSTPLYNACQKGHQDVVTLLLEDDRIDINKPESDQCTPLWFASQNGHLPVVQLILASGREVDTSTRSIGGTAAWNDKTAAQVARRQGTREKFAGEAEEVYARMKRNGPLIADLLDSFDLDPATTRQQLKDLLEQNDSEVIVI